MLTCEALVLSREAHLYSMEKHEKKGKKEKEEKGKTNFLRKPYKNEKNQTIKTSKNQKRLPFGGASSMQHVATDERITCSVGVPPARVPAN